jgi:DNA-directed RNA polymerase specialized sigma24 family protein
MILKIGLMNTSNNFPERKDFDKKVLSNIQYLHPYVKHRLYIAESTQILPKNMYSSNGIIDDCIIKLYDQGFDRDALSQHIKLKLFQLVDDYLEELFRKEAHHTKTISTNTILKEELNRLEESFTIDADLDTMMLEELDDISYHQHDDDYEVFVFDDHNSKIMNSLDLKTESPVEARKTIGKFYIWLPIRVANIVDLYMFGKLSPNEIAKIKHIEVSRVEKTLNEVKKRFRNHID